MKTIEILDESVDGAHAAAALVPKRNYWALVEYRAMKTEGSSEWATERLPETLRPVLQRARAIYLGEHVESWNDLQSELESCVEFVVAEIRN